MHSSVSNYPYFSFYSPSAYHNEISHCHRQKKNKNNLNLENDFNNLKLNFTSVPLCTSSKYILSFFSHSSPTCCYSSSNTSEGKVCANFCCIKNEKKKKIKKKSAESICGLDEFHANMQKPHKLKIRNQMYDAENTEIAGKIEINGYVDITQTDCINDSDKEYDNSMQSGTIVCKFCKKKNYFNVYEQQKKSHYKHKNAHKEIAKFKGAVPEKQICNSNLIDKNMLENQRKKYNFENETNSSDSYTDYISDSSKHLKTHEINDEHTHLNKKNTTSLKKRAPTPYRKQVEKKKNYRKKKNILKD